jgi:ABC-type phosphate transport system substrate-binding protein
MEARNKKIAGIATAVIIVAVAAAVVLWPHNSGVTIRTTGATFPQYQIQKWIDEYQKSHPNVKIEYEGGGSGHGQEAFLQGLTQIGRTDPPVTEDVWNKD